MYSTIQFSQHPGEVITPFYLHFTDKKIVTQEIKQIAQEVVEPGFELRLWVMMQRIGVLNIPAGNGNVYVKQFDNFPQKGVHGILM